MLNELITAGVEADPDRPMVIADTGTVTWAEMGSRARAIAAGLESEGISRFGAVVDDVAELIALLAASAAVGAEACMYARSVDEEVATTLASHFDHDVVITDRDFTLGAARTLHPADLAQSGERDLVPTPGASPLMILTTGTTGLPKGARHDWSRLVSTHRKRMGPSDAKWLLAHLPNQFAGLGVLLHVLTSGSTLVVPADFRPKESLDAIRAHGVTHLSATPTFWRFLLTHLRPGEEEELDFRQITLAGEAVPGPLLDQITGLFPEANISQIYGATEFGSSVAVGAGGNGLPASVLDRPADADVRFRIVDGELEVVSRIGMLGYYGEEDVGDRWRPTGDLVEVQGDRIHFVGRRSETINVGGVKVYPLPIEEVAGGVDGVHMVHAFGRQNPMTGQIVQLDVVPESGVDTDELEGTIRAACESLIPEAQPRRIRFVDQLDVRDTKVARRSPEQQS